MKPVAEALVAIAFLAFALAALALGLPKGWPVIAFILAAILAFSI